MKNFISTNQKRFQDQQNVLSRNSKIETPKKKSEEKRIGLQISWKTGNRRFSFILVLRESGVRLPDGHRLYTDDREFGDTEFRRNDHREDAHHVIILKTISLNRDELNTDLRIAEFKNLQSELGSEFAEYFAKLDLKIIIKNEKVILPVVSSV